MWCLKTCVHSAVNRVERVGNVPRMQKSVCRLVAALCALLLPPPPFAASDLIKTPSLIGPIGPLHRPAPVGSGQGHFPCYGVGGEPSGSWLAAALSLEEHHSLPLMKRNEDQS